MMVLCALLEKTICCSWVLPLNVCGHLCGFEPAATPGSPAAAPDAAAAAAAAAGLGPLMWGV
jgi:hypothetical protein